MRECCRALLYVITGLHVMHVLGGMLHYLLYFPFIAEKYSPENFNGVRMCTVYWHFLGLLWVYLFSFYFTSGVRNPCKLSRINTLTHKLILRSLGKPFQQWQHLLHQAFGAEVHLLRNALGKDVPCGSSMVLGCFLHSQSDHRIRSDASSLSDIWPNREMYLHTSLHSGHVPLAYVGLMTFILIMSSVTMVLAWMPDIR